MSKKEKNAWDRFWLLVKENEKIIWVLLLLLLAPTFAFTGAFSSIMSSSRNSAFASVYGKTIYYQDFLYTRRGLQMVQEIRGGGAFGLDQSSILQYFTYKAEAERLGLRISDTELGAEVRRIYNNLLARDIAMEHIQNLKVDEKRSPDQQRQQAFFMKYRTTLEDLAKKDEFGPKEQKDWFERLDNWSTPNLRGPIPRKYFEEFLRDAMVAEKLDGFVRSTVQVTPQEAFAEYQKEEQSRKISFFEVGAQADKAEVEKAITEEEIKDRFQKRKEEFREPAKIRVTYLSLPLAAFEKKVTLTDEDLLKEYNRVKAQKYQTFVGESLGGFELLSPEQRAERDAKAFRPFDEVKEEVRTELQKTRVREAARAAADKIREKLFPAKPGAIGEKKDGKQDPVPATFDEIAKSPDFDMVKTGTTPWTERKDAEKDMGPDAYAPIVTSWFSQLDAAERDKTGKKDIEPPKTYQGAPTTVDPQHFIFYKKPEVRSAGLRDLADVKDKVKESLVKEKLLEKARAKAKDLIAAVREGKKSFDDAAKEAGSQVVSTGFLGTRGTIRVPMTAEEIQKAEADKTAPAPEPGAKKEKDHPASSEIRDFAFKSVQEKGKADGPAEDPESSLCFVVRWDDTIFPDASRFEESRSTYERKVLQDKQTAYMAQWRRRLYDEAKPGFFTTSSEGEGSRKRPRGETDPYAE